MLERISEIQGIGLLYDAKGKQHAFRKATLIYGDNGRGKSTLATILRSLSTGDVSLISLRKTIDGHLPPKVLLQFENGHKVNFDSGAWSQLRPEVLVFDADFIDRNVHSGGAVNTNQRKNLLEFALGEQAVVARIATEKATTDAKKASEHVQEIVSQLSVFHSGITLAQFEKLATVADAEVQLVKLKSQIGAAGNANAISAKAVPKLLVVPVFNIEEVFSILSISLKDIHVNAEQVVKQHLGKLANANAENWLSQGLQFDDGQKCPYCDQVISDIDLIKAYQTHFNASYSELKKKVTDLEEKINTGTAPTIIDAMAHSIETSALQAQAWTEQVSTKPIVFDSSPSIQGLQDIRDLITDLVCQKKGSPAEPIGTLDDLAKVKKFWDAVINPLNKANASIKAAADLITAYKENLATTNITALQQQVKQIHLAKQRHEQTVIDLLIKLESARKASEAVEKLKKTSRDTLNTLMAKTLSRYELSINDLLTNFGASFRISGMGANFRGSSPRSEYGLVLRGKAVPLEGESLSFATALSEGDKRTLAFAFFVASTVTDVKLSTKTIVIDDPMCSLDVNRKQHTMAVLKRIHAGSKQLIVLAHDPYFLRNLRDAFLKSDSATPISLFQLILSSNDYTSFGALDIDKVCESTYFQHHRLLNDFCNGVLSDNLRVAQAVRPMLEGYLHRRFPGLVPKTLLFGKAVIMIRDSTLSNPLSHAKNLVVELNEINDYVGQFHHDTNPGGADTISITAPELKTFVTRALHVVHRGEALT
jgi:wobble nucleotide-excising tRNase